MTNSIRGRRSRRQKNHQAEKPYEGFPLTAHPSGRWCKKVLGKIHYFGKIADGWEAGYDLWKKQEPDLRAGRTPRTDNGQSTEGGVTMRQLCNAYGLAKRRDLDSGEIVVATYTDCYRTCKRLIERFGENQRVEALQPADFAAFRQELSKTLGRVALGNAIIRSRAVFNFAVAEGIIKAPVSFGTGFDRPTTKALKREQQDRPERIFTAGEIHKLLAVAGIPMKAAILLACNAGFGNSDISALPKRALDLERGWIDFARVKNFTPRHIPLWPATIEAIKAVLATRPTPTVPDAENCVFVTSRGKRWCKESFTEEKVDGKTVCTVNTDNAIAKEFAKLMRKARIVLVRGRSFYALRHAHRTAAGEACDADAADSIMGHMLPGMRAKYVHGVSDERLRKVVDVVHRRLFGTPAFTPAAEQPQAVQQPQQVEPTTGEGAQS